MIFLAFIIIPIIEISIFITIGSKIGILNTIAIILTTALVGIFLIRRQGIKLLFDAQKNLSIYFIYKVIYLTINQTIIFTFIRMNF